MRAVGAVVAGYLVMLILVVGLMTGLYLTLGPDGAFASGSYEPSTVWLIASTLLSITAALAGGFVCAVIAGRGGAPKALAIVVLVIGVLTAALVMNPVSDPRPTVRTPSTPTMEAMMNARQPDWVSWTNPLIGAIGVLVGASWRKRG